MVRGLEIFRQHFKEFTDNYIIIGGTACDIVINNIGLTPRATKDIDIILVIEALSPEFATHFWEFIKQGNYEVKEKSEEDRKYYRFQKPQVEEFPFQIELFSRIPDLLDLEEQAHLTPIPVDTEISSLSAILMDDDYYNFTIKHSQLDNDIHLANTEALIGLKAKAFLDYKTRKENGEKIDERQLRKHKIDVFRLLLLLTPEDNFTIPTSVKADIANFTEAVKTDLPDKQIFKEMGAGNVNVKELFEQLIKVFNI
ncbi:nucleotidyl transferase AbiEii/AbiGii toxin family protein [Flavobacterium johnsoniae]|uniref:Nucleotidyl transferase AbiEii toxin, Type IV TA system n=1 Tax=Flavobacterium johnsoniae TaxID=986 RepID=A0A1M5VQJ4_FLAJO|nr:nucleotidyl transferase AbiEii/AbiGii toxin family protein [Flavobacterium johnsoniae]SHH77203.1 Nucleotidyl transferase AbiEii toxin, Type IV TA system [Flavobacterium johnsoniae]